MSELATLFEAILEASPVVLALVISLGSVVVCGFALFVVHHNSQGKGR